MRKRKKPSKKKIFRLRSERDVEQQRLAALPLPIATRCSLLFGNPFSPCTLQGFLNTSHFVNKKQGKNPAFRLRRERDSNSRLRARSGSALTAHRAVIHYRPVRILSNVNKKQGKNPAFRLRRERDSNPRVLSHKLISSPFGNLEVIEQYYPKLAIFQ